MAIPIIAITGSINCPVVDSILSKELVITIINLNLPYLNKKNYFNFYIHQAKNLHSKLSNYKNCVVVQSTSILLSSNNCAKSFIFFVPIDKLHWGQIGLKFAIVVGPPFDSATMCPQ